LIPRISPLALTQLAIPVGYTDNFDVQHIPHKENMLRQKLGEENAYNNREVQRWQ